MRATRVCHREANCGRRQHKRPFHETLTACEIYKWQKLGMNNHAYVVYLFKF